MRSVREVISNTSPLQYLYQADVLDVLPKLYGRVLVPGAVAAELAEGRGRGVALPDLEATGWIEVRPVTARAPLPLVTDLGAGEREALALAAETPGSLLLLDDLLARRHAQLLGLAFTGTLGVLLKAKREGHVPPAPAVAAAPSAALVASLRAQGFPGASLGFRSPFYGATVLLAGYGLGDALTFSGGVMLAQPIGFLARAAWAPWNAGGTLRPVVALEVPLLLTAPVALGAGASVGIEYAPLPWLVVGAEVPVFFFFAAPGGFPAVWPFVAATTQVRF
jgi:hypothetical protein